MAGIPFDPYAFISKQVMQTRLPYSPFVQPAGCGPGREETPFSMKRGGKIYNFVFRDKIIPEDWYLVATKATAFSIARTEQYRGVPPSRTVRDFLVRNNVVI